MSRTLCLVAALGVVGSFARPAAAQAPDDATPPGSRPPLTMQPLARDAAENGERPSIAIDPRSTLPRLGLVESPYGMPAGTWMVGMTGDATATKNGSTGGSGAEGGLLLGVAPIDRLTIHALLGRDIDAKWSPTLTLHLRVLGSIADGYAVGIVGQYKAEGFTEMGGELEAGLTGGFRTGRFFLDGNVLGGMGLEENEVGEADGEVKVRLGYDVLPGARHSV